MASSSAKINCRKFTLNEIRDAIKGDKILGKGGFGKVCRQYPTRQRKVSVAVKWLKPTSNERGSGFDEEIAALIEIKHCNIVSLIGYCDDKVKEILVYEYVAYSTLDYHLHERPYTGDKTHLKCNERLGILIGSARGLYHLHHGICTNSFIHRDIKSANILLQDNLVAQIGDFGLAKSVALDDHDPLDNVAKPIGMLGYTDPYYLYNEVVTRASDTYSFGIMIFEVLSGRRVVDEMTIVVHRKNATSPIGLNGGFPIPIPSEIEKNALFFNISL